MNATENSLTDARLDKLVADNSSPLEHINILYFINMNASDSVICFVDNEIHNKELPGTSLTFDQPLLVKAVDIVRAKDVSHPDECSRCVFHLMRGSGIEEALGQVYGPVPSCL